MPSAVSRWGYICPSCRIQGHTSFQRRFYTGVAHSKVVVSQDAYPQPARTRFAPSPTGHLHFGSLRTALYNYVYAKRTGGQFVLRLEDTDDKRTIPGAEQSIYEDLRWAGLLWDEGPEVGGPYGPYRQSERTPIYQKAAAQLLESGHAYRCFCSAEDLRLKDQANITAGRGTGYDRTCFHLSKERVEQLVAERRPHTLRLKFSPENLDFTDLTFGKGAHDERQDRKMETLGLYQDIVLLKTNGVPTYHLANVVDDHHMKITHVIRGVEWLISTRKHLALYKALGWAPPRYAHVGLLRDKEQQKLSKRDRNFDLKELRKDGLLPEALNNFLVLLGWSHPAGKEYLTLAEMEKSFDIKFTKSNPIVDLGKLHYLSSKHATDLVTNRGVSPTSIRFQQLLAAVSEAACRIYAPKDLQSIGLDTQDKVSSRCERLLSLSPKSYTTATDFVKSMAPFFSDIHTPQVRKSIKFDRYSKLLSSSHAEQWSQTAIRASLLEALFPQRVNGASTSAAAIPSSSPSGAGDFSNSAEDLFKHPDSSLLHAAVNSVLEKYTALYCSHTRSPAMETPTPSSATETAGKSQPRRANKDQLLMQTHIYTYLRSWLCFGHHGPSIADTLHILGPELARSRIERGEVIWVVEGGFLDTDRTSRGTVKDLLSENATRESVRAQGAVGDG